MSVNLRKAVFDALDANKDNGYWDRGPAPMKDWSDESVAIDLTEFDADLEDAEPATLVPFVAEWRKAK